MVDEGDSLVMVALYALDNIDDYMDIAREMAGQLEFVPD